jgi:uncharacterized protein YndB with AHSA1/START domain
MERKTKISAEDGKQEMLITREFDLPLELLFKACSEADIIEQWMGTRVLKMENKKYGSYQFETAYDGKVVFKANGVFHEVSPNKRIIRTFEMDNAPFGVQLEIHDFEKITDQTSRLNMHVIYESVAQRDEVLKLPFAQGISMAHDRMQEIANKMK